MRYARVCDMLRMLKATFSLRVMNYMALLFSYVFAILIRKPLRRGLPAFVTIEPTSLCNLHCYECPTGRGILTRPVGNMDMKLYSRILDEIAGHTMYLTLNFQGEPYLHPDFLKMVSLAKQKGIYVATSTNAHFPDKETAAQTVRSGLDRIIISFDGPDAAVYKTYRNNGKWENVIQNVRNLIEARKELKSRTPYIILQCLIIRSNEHRLQEVRALSKELGADRIEFKTIQLLYPSAESELLPENPQFSRYKKKKGDGYLPKNRLKKSCFKVWSSCVITWDGLVVPCCYDKDTTHGMGHMDEKTLKAIWKGDHYQEFIKEVFTHRPRIKICYNCPE